MHIVVRVKNNLDNEEEKQESSLTKLSILQDAYVPNQEVVGSGGRVATGIYYYIQNKWWVLRSMPCNLDADLSNPSNPNVFGILRTDSLSDNCLWRIIPNDTSPYYFIQVKWWADRCMPCNLDADASSPYDKERNGILRTSMKSDNCLWKFTPNASSQFHFIQVKWWLERSMPCNLDADLSNPSNPNVRGVLRTDSLSDNCLWRFIPCNYEFKANIQDFKYDSTIYDLSKYAKKDPGAVIIDVYNHTSQIDI
jgi:hypothetical protein